MVGDFEYYYVLSDNKPYLKVEVGSRNSFDDAIIYNNHLLIGASEKVYFINLSDFEIKGVRFSYTLFTWK